jgi:hypothetical protein
VLYIFLAALTVVWRGVGVAKRGCGIEKYLSIPEGRFKGK